MADSNASLNPSTKREPDFNAPPTSPPRKRKRPGAGSRINRTQIEEAQKREFQREQQALQQSSANGYGSSATPSASVSDFVKQHYNAVPERGRDWRRTESNIRGLRSYNNWVKSVLIIKHAPKTSGFKILDVGCGKGGDLQKWRHQNPSLYVGLDPADVSIQQASGRYREMKQKSRGRGLFHAEFGVKDCFGESLDSVQIVREVGFDKSNDPRWGGGGFDVVSMMFCMHYAFESEEKARIMLKNVAGALKKGGKFLGVIPNSDIISLKVQEWHKANGTAEVPKEETNSADDEDERPTFVDSDDDDERPTFAESDDERPTFVDSDDEGWNPEKQTKAPKDHPSTDKDAAPEPNDSNDSKPAEDKSTAPPVEPIEWGNSIYKVQFPTHPPASGIFRPPFGWKYFFYLAEAVDTVPEYVVPWERFRGLAEDFNLELQYRKTFGEMWEDEKNDREFGQLAERMGVQSRNGNLLVEQGEMEAANFYHAFCFYKV